MPNTDSLQWTDSLAGVDWHELSELYRLAPLGHKPPEGLKTAFTNSRYRWFVREHGQLVGVGRALADGFDAAYLCDIAVRPSHQGTGLGKAIVSRLLEQSKGHRKILLYAVPGKEAFYGAFGFLRMKTAMAVFDDPAQAIERGFVASS
jgi:GNAT superfamily N-acetyltransferase